MTSNIFGNLKHLIIFILSFLFFAFSVPNAVAQQPHLADVLSRTSPASLFDGATRFGPPQGTPPITPVYRDQALLGYAYLNTDFTNAVGYSGKPIHMLVAIDPQGVVRAVKLVAHSEPIVLIGIPEKQVADSMNALIGRDMAAVSRGQERPPQVDIVSGATVTVLVMGDSVVRSAVRLIRSGRLSPDGAAPAAQTPHVTRSIDMQRSERRSWADLVGDGSIRRLSLTVGEVSRAYAATGQPGSAIAAERPETDNPDDVFINMYVAPVSVPTIGRSLLGDDGYRRLRERIGPDQQAIVIAGEGAYSFKGSGYVRGGIFDRIELLQDGSGLRFHDHSHTRLGALEADGAPRFPEIALFVVPTSFTFDLTSPWQIQLLVQRAISARDKAFLTYDLEYTLPEQYLVPLPPAAATPAATTQPAADDMMESFGKPVWQMAWEMKTGSVIATGIALLILTAIFFFQDMLVKYPRTFRWIRRLYLVFALVWLGWIANTQLSVVNVFAFTNALLTQFKWETFLADPLVFILWCSVAASLLFWGRGAFCGWLCPFGALQELLNNLAKAVKIPQVRVPWGLHERLWPVKYILFMALFGLSIYDIALAEHYAEIEPFKTSIILKFAREWPFVVYALALLALGLVIERFFCRYLCPLGAALAIPGRLRMFEWLKRWPECGSPCQRCANDCPVQSIHPEGHINVNECIYCMNCQELYHDEHRCPPMIQKRLLRERRKKLAQPAEYPDASAGGGKPVITRNGKPIGAAHATPPMPLPGT